MDIIEVLEDNNIRIWRRGKNVSAGWIGLQCPFCGDESNHLGIRLKDLKCRCWKCGRHTITRVLHSLLDVTYTEASNIADDLDKAEEVAKDDYDIIDKRYEGRMAVKLPEGATKHFPKLHTQYLRSRGFKPRKLIREWNLRAVNIHGPYKFRIIIPVYYDGMIITFTSRDVTDQAGIRYKAAPKNVYPNPKHYVYGLSRASQVGSNAILVEGPTDVWRLGAGAISFFGVSQHEKQLAQLVRSGIKTLHILFDNDTAGKQASWRLAKMVKSFVSEVNLITLKDYPDPGSMPQEDADLLMMELGFRG